MKKILVAGGMGYIGSHTVVELVSAGYEPIIVDNLSNSSESMLEPLEKLCGMRPKFYKADIRDRAAMDRIFAENEIDAVIHFAGLKAVAESVSMPIEYYENNINGTLVLCEAMRAADCRKLVFSSSATVYGPTNEPPYTEDMPTSATNPYGWTKVMIEHILEDICTADPEWKVLSLRYFNPIGAHESGLIGEEPNGIPNNLFPYIARVASGKFDHLKVTGTDYPTPDGTGVRDYIHVVDLATGHIAALKRLDEQNGYDAINLGTGRGSSVFDVLHAFEKACGRELPYKIYPRRPGDLAFSFANVDKAKRLLGWEAKYDMDRMCADGWRYIENVSK